MNTQTSSKQAPLNFLARGNIHTVYTSPLAPQLIWKYSKSREDFLMQKRIFHAAQEEHIIGFARSWFAAPQALIIQQRAAPLMRPNRIPQDHIIWDAPDIILMLLGIERECLALFYDYYGRDETEKLINFLLRYDCCDLHRGNLGIIRGAPVIIDLISTKLAD